MNEATFFLLRLFLWLLPGIAAFLSLRAFLSRRSRVGFGLLIAALVFTAFVKPWVLGLLSLGIGALVALGPRRKTAGKWLESTQRLPKEREKP